MSDFDASMLFPGDISLIVDLFFCFFFTFNQESIRVSFITQGVDTVSMNISALSLKCSKSVNSANIIPSFKGIFYCSKL